MILPSEEREHIVGHVTTTLATLTNVRIRELYLDMMQEFFDEWTIDTDDVMPQQLNYIAQLLLVIGACLRCIEDDDPEKEVKVASIMHVLHRVGEQLERYAQLAKEVNDGTIA